MKRFAITAVVYLVAFTTTAFLANALFHNGLGRGDLGPLLFWSLPAILLSSFIIALIAKNLPDLSEPVSLIVRTFVALGCAAISTIMVRVLFGVWFGMMNLSPMLPNLAGALAATIVAPGFLANRRTGWRRPFLFFVMIVLTCAAGIPGASSLLRKQFLRGGQIATASILLKDSQGPLNTEEIIRIYCPNYVFDQADWDEVQPHGPWKDLIELPCMTPSLKILVAFHQSINKAPVSPWLSVSHRLAHYEDVHSSVLFAFPPEMHLPTGGLEFDLPEEGSVIYYLSATGWQKFPKDAKVSNRKIKMTNDYQESGEEELTPILCISVEDIDGQFDGPECANVLPDGVRLTVEAP